jgi:alpha-L-arabinofuranosidase
MLSAHIRNLCVFRRLRGEFFTRETAMRIPNTIGPVRERPAIIQRGPPYDKLAGLHEYLHFARTRNRRDVIVYNCGMSCQARVDEL